MNGKLCECKKGIRKKRERDRLLRIFLYKRLKYTQCYVYIRGTQTSEKKTKWIDRVKVIERTNKPGEIIYLSIYCIIYILYIVYCVHCVFMLGKNSFFYVYS